VRNFKVDSIERVQAPMKRNLVAERSGGRIKRVLGWSLVVLAVGACFWLPSRVALEEHAARIGAEGIVAAGEGQAPSPLLLIFPAVPGLIAGLGVALWTRRALVGLLLLVPATRLVGALGAAGILVGAIGFHAAPAGVGIYELVRSTQGG